MSDFIIVPRSIFDADKFGREQYSKREAFLDLVQMAAYDDTYTFINGRRYSRMRGQVIASKSYLAKRWGWGIDKVRRFLSFLEYNGWCECLCDQQCNQPITTISINSYDSYQGGATISTTTPTTQLKEEIKEKKTSNEVKEKSRRFVKPTVEQIRAYISEKGLSINAEHFFDFYESKGWLVGKSPMKDWKAAVRQWASRDSQPVQAPAEPKDSKEDAMHRATHPTQEEVNRQYTSFFLPQYPPQEGEQQADYRERIRPTWDKFYNQWIARRVEAVNNKY